MDINTALNYKNHSYFIAQSHLSYSCESWRFSVQERNESGRSWLPNADFHNNTQERFLTLFSRSLYYCCKVNRLFSAWLPAAWGHPQTPWLMMTFKVNILWLLCDISLQSSSVCVCMMVLHGLCLVSIKYSSLTGYYFYHSCEMWWCLLRWRAPLWFKGAATSSVTSDRKFKKKLLQCLFIASTIYNFHTQYGLI